MLRPGDQISLFLSEETLGKFQKKETGWENRKIPEISLSVLYEDADVLFLNKPAGMLSQKAKQEDVSLCEYLVSYLQIRGAISSQEMRAFRPSVCNRLDRNTSGLVAAGKSMKGLQTLSALLRERKVEKWYLALVHGQVKMPGHHIDFLRKDETNNRVSIEKSPREGSEKIETEYIPLDVGKECTLLRVRLITGKTHQIRAHLAALGYPILGDSKYGNAQKNREIASSYGMSLKRQMLHSYQMVFPQEISELPLLEGKKILAPLPEDFSRCLLRLHLTLGKGED